MSEVMATCVFIYDSRSDTGVVRYLKDIVIGSSHNYQIIDWAEQVATASGQEGRTIIDTLRKSIADSRRVVAVLDGESGPNPNVLYECGFTHGFGFRRPIPVRLITVVEKEGLSKLPFDLQAFVHVKHSEGALDSGEASLFKRLLDPQPDELVARFKDQMERLQRSRAWVEGSEELESLVGDINNVCSYSNRTSPEQLELCKELVRSADSTGVAIASAHKGVRQDFLSEAKSQLRGALLEFRNLLSAKHELPSPRSIEAYITSLSNVRSRVSAVTNLRLRAAAAIGALVGIGIWAGGALLIKFSGIPVPSRYLLPGCVDVALAVFLAATGGALARWSGLRGAFTFLFLLFAALICLNFKRLNWGNIGSIEPETWQAVARSGGLLVLLASLVALIRGPRSLGPTGMTKHVLWLFVISCIVLGVAVALQAFLPGTGAAISKEVSESPLAAVSAWGVEIWTSIGLRVALTMLVYGIVRALMKVPWVLTGAGRSRFGTRGVSSSN